MSRASKLTLAGTSLFAAGTIVFVHFQQKFEKQVFRTFPYPLFVLFLLFCAHSELQAMHQGVVRDMEQQRIKKERQLDFDIQKALEEEYKKGQTVRDTTAESPPEGTMPNR